MQINLSKFIGFLTGVASVALIGGFGYFMYLVFFVGPEPEQIPSLETISVGTFGPKLQKAASAVRDKKIQLDKKNISFTESALFKSFTDVPDSVPLSDTRGRDDPFVPYVAP